MFNRWLVRELYYGKFNATRIICTTSCINDAAFVIDGLLMQHSGRPYIYVAEKCSSDYVDYQDDIIQHDDLTDQDHDYSEYVDGIDCIEYGNGV